MPFSSSVKGDRTPRTPVCSRLVQAGSFPSFDAITRGEVVTSNAARRAERGGRADGPGKFFRPPSSSRSSLSSHRFAGFNRRGCPLCIVGTASPRGGDPFPGRPRAEPHSRRARRVRRGALCLPEPRDLACAFERALRCRDPGDEPERFPPGLFPPRPANVGPQHEPVPPSLGCPPGAALRKLVRRASPPPGSSTG